MPDRLTRREFLRETAAATAGLAVTPGLLAKPPEETAFASRWGVKPDRVWLGEDYWANPLQDWRVAQGRIECINAAPDRNVHLLTRQVGSTPAGDLQMSVRVGRCEGQGFGDGAGSVGFRIGIQGPLREYRNSLVFGQGLNAGLTAAGKLFIGDRSAGKETTLDAAVKIVELRLVAGSADGGYRLTLSAYDPVTDRLLGEVTREMIEPSRLEGNIALVANFGAAQGGAGAKRGGPATDAGRFWFSDWRVSGSLLEAHPKQAFGPILFNQYSLSRGVMKMTVQMPPVGEQDGQKLGLEIQRDGGWKIVGTATMDPQSRTATFRVEKWNDAVETPYRILYGTSDIGAQPILHTWSGTIRRDPVHAPVLTVADVSCNIHAAFPNAEFTAKMAKLNPDVLAFVGDQFYENTGGYGTRRDDLDAAILDYLRKWYFHGWTWRELTRDRPSLALPDDHDVYQGNLWGENGRLATPTQESGGYGMPAAWVNVVHRTQTGHHPDAFDPAPCEQGITAYFGSMTYGGVSFAIIADRQFKSGPEGKVPPTGGRADHVSDANFDVKKADLPGLELLGERQMKFLREWVRDWHGAEMKAVISQTIFTAMATTHGGERERLIADYDANGWPQTPRNAALREIRKAFAFHIAGDQHLPAIVQYGIDEHRDGPVAFAGPAVNVGYPRWFEPAKPGAHRREGAPDNTGDFTDCFGHPMTVYAVANGAVQPRKPVMEFMQDKASGLGLVRFEKRSRKIIVECWPFLADPTQPGTQFPGWPATFAALDNYARKPVAHLPELKIKGVANPVIEVIDEKSGELVYALRLAGDSWQPHVFAAGNYTVKLSEPETGKAKELRGLAAAENPGPPLEVTI